ncbi:M56 family metallopeptidase [Pedococcus sp. NPDC057267]|uniref:M56 family metallopeptidase n=1 Tax=Pedococcus sp. NPDC057267 TaxID=3346077 RepID=UPI003639C385
MLAVLLAGPAPRVMAPLVRFRRAPLEALLVWQAVSLAAVVSALAVAPAAWATGGPSWWGPVATLIGVAVLARLLWSGHRVGTGIRADRRRHRQLVDVLGTEPPRTGAAVRAGGHVGELRVLAHPTPTAYCLPGLRRRVVLSEGALQALPPEELAAVLAHEQAHLRARHDLVLEFFTVLHRSAPERLRAPEALREVRLLVEVLADRAARRAVGEVPLARALVTLASGHHPSAALGAADPASTSATRARMELLTQQEAPRWLRALMTAFALAVLATPVALLLLALR